MKKELIISIIIIIAVIIGNILTQKYTKQCVAMMNNDLLELKSEIISKDKDKFDERIEKMKNNWDEMQNKLAFYIEHDELEKVETQLSLMKGYIKVGKNEEAIPELENCVFILEHIQDKSALDIKNIF